MVLYAAFDDVEVSAIGELLLNQKKPNGPVPPTASAFTVIGWPYSIALVSNPFEDEVSCSTGIELTLIATFEGRNVNGYWVVVPKSTAFTE